MRVITFSTRTAKEIIRDPVTVFFGIGFPVVIMLLLSLIQSNIPVDLFSIKNLAPGICVFGLSFITLFSASLISRDRKTAFFQRLYISPMTASDFILGYALPMIPLSFLQSIVCYTAAVCLGLNANLNLLFAVLWTLPLSIFFISLGLLFGSLFSDKQIGAICGGALTTLTAWLSGAWFDPKIAGKTFEKTVYALPFIHATELQRAVLVGNYNRILPHMAWVLSYAVIFAVLACVIFTQKMKRL